jgi:membrane protein implicated in regulation of membrane protease activity
MMWNVWWVWIVAGFSLGVLEILAPGYIFLGFAIGALLTGGLLGLGVLGGSLPLLLVVFALLSLASWFVLRRAVGVAPGQKKIWHKDIND